MYRMPAVTRRLLPRDTLPWSGGYAMPSSSSAEVVVAAGSSLGGEVIVSVTVTDGMMSVTVGPAVVQVSPPPTLVGSGDVGRVL